jgi:hypothetical protein
MPTEREMDVKCPVCDWRFKIPMGSNLTRACPNAKCGSHENGWKPGPGVEAEPAFQGSHKMLPTMHYA